MKAVRIHSFGGPEVLQLEEIPTPQPKAGEVLIQVRAAGVNPVDYRMRSGAFRGAQMRPPLTLGREVSGVVASVGSGVSGFEVGDEVYAMLGSHSGGYAEYSVARSQEVAAKPSSLDYTHAAAVPLAALTAWQGLFEHGKLKSGERVLIHGAAGGVGQFAVQFADYRGAFVIATAAAADAELLLALGADQVIDREDERFDERVRDVDLVLDLAAGEARPRSWDVLRAGGRIISTLAPPQRDQALRRYAEGRAFMTEPRREQLTEIGRLIDAGKIRVVLNLTLPLSEARQAHDHMERDHIPGKVVLTVAG